MRKSRKSRAAGASTPSSAPPAPAPLGSISVIYCNQNTHKPRRRQALKALKVSRQYELLRQVQAALPNAQHGKPHEIKTCCKSTIGNLQIYEDGSAANLKRCRSPWSCPVCSPAYLIDRQIELDELMHEVYKYSRGYTAAMLTFTIPHSRADRLDDLIALHARARNIFHNSVAWRRVAKTMPGRVSGKHCTYSERNGWHWHSHDILILPDDAILKENEKALRKAWVDSCKKAGLHINRETRKDMNNHSFDIIYKIHSARYLTSHGKELPLQTDEEEAAGVSPFELIESNMGKYQEFLYATIGVERISWSKGLRRWAGIERREEVRRKERKRKNLTAREIPNDVLNFAKENGVTAGELVEYVREYGLHELIRITLEYQKDKIEAEKTKFMLQNPKSELDELWDIL